MPITTYPSNAHDRSAGAKQHQGRLLLDRLWKSGQGVLSTQVLQELCINLRRKCSHPLPVYEFRELIRDYSAWEVVTSNSESVLDALEIEARYKTSFWDALILQAAHTAGASVLYSEDLAVGQMYGTVQVVNPFREPLLFSSPRHSAVHHASRVGPLFAMFGVCQRIGQCIAVEIPTLRIRGIGVNS